MDQQRLQAMQALMHRMGMGGDVQIAFGGMPTGGGGNVASQMQQILTKIKNHGSEVDQLDGLNEFVNVLNMATEATIMNIHPQHYVGPIMACLTKQHNPELMLVAARSLTYLVDANTHTVRVLQRDDHLTTLLDSLRSIMDVEFAEQVLTCVDKICTDDPAMVLQKDGVSAIMGFLDFFSITTQRLILHTVARMADVFRPAYYNKIESSLPTLRQCLRHDDNRMKEESLTALTRFIKRSASDHNCVKNIFGDAGPAIMEILEKRPNNAMFGTAIQLISTATHASAAVCEKMIEIGAVTFFAGLLEANNQSLLGGTNNNNNSMVANTSGVFTATPSNGGDGGSPLRPISHHGSPNSNSTSAVGASASNITTATPNASQRIPHERIIDICNCLMCFAPEVVDANKKHYLSFIELADTVKAAKKTAAVSTLNREESDSVTTVGNSDEKKKSSKGGDSSSKKDKSAKPKRRAEAEAKAERRAARAFLRAMALGRSSSSSDDDNNHNENDEDDDDDDDDEAFVPNFFGEEEGEDFDGGFGEEEDDEEYEDFDPRTLSPSEQKEHLQGLVETGELKIENKPERNSRCVLGRHTCDVCGDRLADPGLWLRCNSRDDYDVCAACLLELDGDEGHTFTWMKDVLPPAPPVAASAPAPARAAAATEGATSATKPAVVDEVEDQRAQRIAMIEKAPYLVNRLAEALPVMTRLHINSDDPMIRKKCLTFISRVVHHATADCLRAALLDCPMCELVTFLLTSEQLSVLALCIHICQQLIKKLPDVYTDLFIREGVTNGLAVVKSGVSVDKRNESATAPIAQVVQTIDGWKAILAYEANEILNTFDDSVDSGRIAAMEALCTQLRSEADADRPAEALKKAADILSDLSTFELMNSDLVASVLAMFSKTANPEELVARFVSQLASISFDSPHDDQQQQQHQYATLLERFVHQLQSAVSQMEKFQAAFDGTENVKDPIRLTLKPHDPAAGEKEKHEKEGKEKQGTASSTGVRKSNSFRKKNRNTDEEEEADNDNPRSASSGGKMKKGATTALKKGGGKNKNSAEHDEDGGADNDNSNADASSAPVMKKTEGKTATVSIDPLASVFGIVDFIRTNLLPNSPKNLTAPANNANSSAARRRGGGGSGEEGSGGPQQPPAEDEDAVEEIDPTAIISSPVAPTPPSLSFGGATPPPTNEAVTAGGGGDNENATKRTRKETAAAALLAGNSGASPTTTAPQPLTPANTPIYLRYKTHALQSQWTMLQVMHTIVKKDREEEDKKRRAGGGRHSSTAENPFDIPWQLRHLAGLVNSGQAVEIYYSTEPYTSPTVTTAQQQPQQQPTTDANGGAQSQQQQQRPVRFNPNLLLTSGAIAVRTAITKPYSLSSKFVSAPLANVLKLLNILYAACSEWQSLMTWLAMQSGSFDLPKSLSEPRIAHAEFVNPKINSKAMQHASIVAMAGQHETAWYVCMLHDYPCLFTPATRRFMFEVTYFGVSRSLLRIHELAQESGTLVDAERANAGRRQNRIVRRKCRVVREKPLECAMQVLASGKATLGSVFEFEFKGEPGSGLGPTMEFYSLVGNALADKNLSLWRRSEEDSETHFCPTLGLFPAPFVSTPSSSSPTPAIASSNASPSHPASPLSALPTVGTAASTNGVLGNAPQSFQHARQESHIVKHFTFMGRFLARVLLDRRIPNLRLSRPLLKMLRGDELAFDDIYCISPKVYEVLLAMVISDHSDNRGYLATLPRPCSVEDLCLNFTLPGMEEIPLIPQGADTDVTNENMAHYAQELSTAMLCGSVNTAVKALREGFSSVISLQALRALTLDELSGTLKGHEERITLAELEANVACDHGYSASSPTIRIFLEILSEMSVEGQQKFFQFLTGSAMLPVGGLAALKPKFTIVRKTSSDPKVPEQVQLPSAMTCQNFLKLPAYETKELMTSKLQMAIDEGANAFLFT